MTERLQEQYDAVVVGGGAAGLNGALMLARSRRSVLVVDAGAPRNAPAEAMHGMLGHDGLSPAELLARGRAEMRSYGGELVAGEVVGAERRDDEFVVRLADGRTVKARRLLVTTGLVDELPAIDGLRERWGHDVVHCPYCHGWEVRDRAIGVIATGPMAVHQALLFRQLSDDVVLFANDQEPLGAEDAAKLAAVGVPVISGEVAAVEVGVDDAGTDTITGLRLADGSVQPRAVVVVGTRMVARASFLAGLGLSAAEHPMGEYVPTDEFGRTDVPGVWAAGNVTDLSAQVGASAAAGALAGAQINADLVMADATRS